MVENMDKLLVKKVVLYGAGQEAYKILTSCFCSLVSFLVDRDPQKVGTYICGKRIVDYDTFLKERNNMDVVVTISNPNEMIEKIGLNAFSLDYFRKEECCEYLDKHILLKVKFENLADYCFLFPNLENWYRPAPCSKRNKMLIQGMKTNDFSLVSSVLADIYKNDRLYQSDYIDNRPSMRLVKNILSNEQIENKNATLVDLFCGNGIFLISLLDTGIKTVGVDSCNSRIEPLKKKYGIDVYNGDAEHVCLEDSSCDYVTCFEGLEHVGNVVNCVLEINRILKVKGKCFCSVPDAKNFDCDEHVRQFDENLLFSLFSLTGFKVKTIIKLPYVNTNLSDNNIFIEAEKIENRKN